MPQIETNRQHAFLLPHLDHLERVSDRAPPYHYVPTASNQPDCLFRPAKFTFPCKLDRVARNMQDESG